MRWEFATAARIVFGPGAISDLPEIVSAWGSRPMLVTGRDPSRAEAAGVRAFSVFPVAGEPTVEIARKGAAQFCEHGCDVVVSAGGGSALDAGKAIAALAANSGDVLDYLEVVGRGMPLERAPYPFIAVPTTAGTGSEVTRNAVLGSPEHGVKASLRSPQMLAKAAVVDPQLTIGLPPQVTAATGLDALTQLIEPYVSIRANPMTDGFCREGIRRVAPSLLRAYRDGSDAGAREDMACASLLGGLALANAGLGIVHGFAAPIGGMFDAPHGAVCAAVLPHGMRANIAALRRRAPDSEALRRYAEIARLLTGGENAAPEAGADWVEELAGALHVPKLSEYGIGAGNAAELAAKAEKASSTKANPVVLTREELMELVRAA